MYQFAYTHTGRDPVRQWKDPRVRVHVHAVEGGYGVITLLQHELRNYRTGGDWYRLPPDVAELVPYMMDEGIEATARREHERVRNAEYKRAERARKRTRTP